MFHLLPTLITPTFKSVNIYCKIIRCFDRCLPPNYWVLGGQHHTFLPVWPTTYSPCFNNSFSHIACYPNKNKASICSSFNIIRFLAHKKSAFGKLLFEHTLDAWVAKQRLTMVATQGSRYSRLCHHFSADTLFSWPTGLQTHSKQLSSSYLHTSFVADSVVVSVLVCCCNIHGILSSSMPYVVPPCSSAMLLLLLLVKDYHDVASVDINKFSINPSALETCAPKTAQLHDFKFLVYT